MFIICINLRPQKMSCAICHCEHFGLRCERPIFVSQSATSLSQYKDILTVPQVLDRSKICAIITITTFKNPLTQFEVPTGASFSGFHSNRSFSKLN